MSYPRRCPTDSESPAGIIHSGPRPVKRKEEVVVVGVGVLLALWVIPAGLAHGGKIAAAVLLAATGLALWYVRRSGKD